MTTARIQEHRGEFGPTDGTDGTDGESGPAGTPGSQAGGIFADPLTSKLASWPLKNPAPFASQMTSRFAREARKR